MEALHNLLAEAHLHRRDRARPLGHHLAGLAHGVGQELLRRQHLQHQPHVAGLGGRAITREALRRTFLEAAAGKLAPLTFLDLNHEVVDRALKREREVRRTGPLAESLLRDVGLVTAQLR